MYERHAILQLTDGESSNVQQYSVSWDFTILLLLYMAGYLFSLYFNEKVIIINKIKRVSGLLKQSTKL